VFRTYSGANVYSSLNFLFFQVWYLGRRDFVLKFLRIIPYSNYAFIEVFNSLSHVDSNYAFTEIPYAYADEYF
jgi:hypothetical protein